MAEDVTEGTPVSRTEQKKAMSLFKNKITELAEDDSNATPSARPDIDVTPAKTFTPPARTSEVDPNLTGEITDPPPATDEGKKKPTQWDQARGLIAKKDTELEEARSRIKELENFQSEATTLKERLAEREKTVEELDAWRGRYNLLRSDEFNNKIAIPRQNIKAAITKELEADGIDADVWELAQKTESRRDLERVVDGHIESTLLKQQFYNLFFQDLELRKQESLAIEAPKKYLETVQAEEATFRSNLKEAAKTQFQDVFHEAIGDATRLSENMGENKIIELVNIPGNSEHNEKIVAPLHAVADKAAEAMLLERFEVGLPVTREIASRTVYLWRQAVASQAVSKDRMRWYNEAEKNRKEAEGWKTKYDKLLEKGNPGTRTSAGSVPSEGDNTKFKRGKDLKETIANFAKAESGS